VESEFDVPLFFRRLAHYAFAYTPGPKCSEHDAADRAKQAHLDGRLAIQLARLVDANPDVLDDDWLKEASSSESE
jgi:uncharacterized protein YciW